MNLSFSRTVLSVAVASFSSSMVSASESLQVLDQMIVSASRVEQPKADYTGNITVITNEQLTEKAIQTLPEALDRIAGISLYGNGGLGATNSLYVRGHDSKRLLLLVDGMRFNDPSSIGGAQWQHLLVSDIERIEILPSAQAGIWGADAAAGVINVMTQKAAEGTHGSLAYSMGTLGQKQTQGSVSYANQDFDARLSYTGLSSDEFSSITPIINGVKQNPLDYEKDGYRNDTLNAKLGWNLAKNQRLELSAFKSDASGQYDASAPNHINLLSYQQQTLGATYRFNLADWQFALNAQEGSIERDFNGSLFNATTNQQSLVASRQDDLGHWTLGVDASEQASNRMNNTVIGQKQVQKGLFFVRSHRFYLPQVAYPTLINLSLRHDDFNDYQSDIGKRLGIKQMLSKDAYFSMNMAETRRMPNLFERFMQYDSNYQTTVRTDVGGLRPESVESQELSLGWKGYSVTHFEDKVTDLIDYDFVNRNYYNRGGDSHLSGWEWKASEPLPSLDSEISASYQTLDAKDQKGIPLARRPESSGSFGWTYLGISKTLVTLQTQYVGTRIDSYHSSTGVAGVNTGNYWLWHANASYQWNKAVRVFVKGINLSDESIAQATNSYNASIPTNYYAYSPRTFLAGIEYKF